MKRLNLFVIFTSSSDHPTGTVCVCSDLCPGFSVDAAKYSILQCFCCFLVAMRLVPFILLNLKNICFADCSELKLRKIDFYKIPVEADYQSFNFLFIRLVNSVFED